MRYSGEQYAHKPKISKGLPSEHGLCLQASYSTRNGTENQFSAFLLAVCQFVFAKKMVGKKMAPRESHDHPAMATGRMLKHLLYASEN